MPRNQMGDDCQRKDDGAFYQIYTGRGGKMRQVLDIV